MKLALLVGVSVAVATGCAGITTKPLSKDPSKAASDPGIRYVQDAPFLLVYSDGKGGLNSDVLFLPDTSQKMSVHPYAVLASNKTTLNFTKGVLTSQKTTVDETIVPKAVLSALETAAGAAIKAAFNVPGERAQTELPAPFLFRILVDGETTSLVQALGPDGQALAPIRVTVSAPKEQ